MDIAVISLHCGYIWQNETFRIARDRPPFVRALLAALVRLAGAAFFNIPIRRRDRDRKFFQGVSHGRLSMSDVVFPTSGVGVVSSTPLEVVQGRMMTKQPFMPLFFGDFLAATGEWAGEEMALYLVLLGHEWVLGSLPNDPVKLCRLVRWDQSLFDRCWGQVSTKFVVGTEGRLINIRLELHREKASEISAKNSASGKKGAAVRWQKDGERHSGRHRGAKKTPMPRANGESAMAHGNGYAPMTSRMAIHTNPNEEKESEASQGEEGGSPY